MMAQKHHRRYPNPTMSNDDKIFELQQEEQQELNMIPAAHPLIHLPLELQVRVVSFLGAHDALTLSQSCKSLHSDLALSVLSPSLKLFEKLDWSASDADGDDDTIHRAFRLPVYNTNTTSIRVHSVRFDCVWGDQGWGNCKGEAWVVAFPPSSSIPNDVNANETTFTGAARIVAHSRLESHARSRLRMTLSPVNGEEYHFYYRVGGGGGHRLFFLRGSMHALIYDDQRHSLSRSYRLLRQSGALKAVRFSSDMTCHGSHQAIATSDTSITVASPELLAVCQLLRRQHLDAEECTALDGERRLQSPELHAVLEACGLPTDTASINAVLAWLQEDIVDRILWKQETSARTEKTMTRSNSGRTMGIRERLGQVRATRWPQPILDDDYVGYHETPLPFCSIM
jgi:hypothetical protein